MITSTAGLVGLWREMADQWRSAAGICAAAGDSAGAAEATARAEQLELCADDLADHVRLVVSPVVIDPAQRN